MSKTLIAAAAACLAFTAASALALSARAADPDFCRDYARSAVNQYRQAMEHDRCRDRIRDYSRWSPDWQHHYSWCVNVSRDQAWDERRAREDVLDRCTHGEDFDHDRYDHDRYDHDHYDHY